MNGTFREKDVVVGGVLDERPIRRRRRQQRTVCHLLHLDNTRALRRCLRPPRDVEAPVVERRREKDGDENHHRRLDVAIPSRSFVLLPLRPRLQVLPSERKLLLQPALLVGSFGVGGEEGDGGRFGGKRRVGTFFFLLLLDVVVEATA